MFREEDINRFLNGRQFFILATVLFVVSALLSPLSTETNMHNTTSGVCFSLSSLLESHSIISKLMSMASIVGVCALLSLVNKTYSFIRDVTYVFASSFIMLNIANPEMAFSMSDGTLLCLVVSALTYLLFGIYQSSYPQRRVFLISVILSACCMFQYTFLYLIPVFFIGFLQMRAMSVRSFLAMLFGLITPFWIVWGTGIVGIEEMRTPQMSVMLSGFAIEQSRYFIALLSGTIFFTIVLLFANVLQIINYKMQVRAYNGFFLVLTVFTMIMMVVDYNNVMSYLSILNMCLSIQIAHTFTIQKYLRRYIPYLLFVMGCMVAFIFVAFC